MVINKRGWLRVVEASIAVMIIISALLVVSNNIKVSPDKTDYSFVVKNILNNVVNNETLRNSILDYDTSKDSAYLNNRLILYSINSSVSGLLPVSSFDYLVKICKPEEVCNFSNKKEVYSSERIVFTSLTRTDFSPRKIRIFIWTK